jgi:hypothetical protein
MGRTQLQSLAINDDCRWSLHTSATTWESRAVAQAGSRWLPTAAARVRMWGLWWTKRHWGRFSPSTSVSPANQPINFSIIIITRGWHNRPISGRGADWTQLDSTHHYTNLKIFTTRESPVETPLVAWIYIYMIRCCIMLPSDTQCSQNRFNLPLSKCFTNSVLMPPSWQIKNS